MSSENLNDLTAFLAVATDQSFTRAAAKLGVSQSALSQTVRGLEQRLGIRLLTRTTRRVTPTQAGERLLQNIGPRIEEIRAEMSAVAALSGKPAGTVRLVSSENAAHAVLMPALQRVLPLYPGIKVEVVIDYGLTDIVAERFDAGVRHGEIVANGMISVPIGPDMRMAVVGTPSYFEAHGRPATPQDLTRHNCINLRLPTYGGLYAWEFEKDGQTIRVRVDGQLIFSTAPLILDAALCGLGVAYLTQQASAEHLASGRLVRILEAWCPPFSGYHLYYPHRRASSPAFAVLVDALRYRA
jgi:DNA-binding transcriptional LysR family regulator